MKITTVNNQELVIQARNEADFKNAMKVAKSIVKVLGQDMAAITSICEFELWVHICFIDMPYQAKEIRDCYNVAKKELNNFN